MELLDREGKYGPEWGISDGEGIYWIERGNIGPTGEYRTARENIGQRGKILDKEGKYSIEAEKYWTETGNMRQRREISVGEVK